MRLKRARLVAQQVSWEKQRAQDDEVTLCGERMSACEETATPTIILSLRRPVMREKSVARGSMIFAQLSSLCPQIRRTTQYKMLLYLGKAPCLRSDTHREVVLKQFPL